MKIVLERFVILAFALRATTVSAAQAPTVPGSPGSDVQITVTNERGVTVSAATVSLDVDGHQFAAASDGQGHYQLAVPAGDYLLIIGAEGFATFSKAIRVAPNGPTRLVVTLRVQFSEHIEVHGVDPGAASGLTISGDALLALSRNSDDLLRTLQQMAGTRGAPGDVALYVNGFNVGRMPPLEAIALIRINANPFSAEFVEPGSRRIEVVTKAGAEDRYGQFGLLFNDSALNAQPALSTVPNAMTMQNYTGSFGTPIIAKRWGLSLYGGRFNQDDTASVRATTLDAGLQPTLFTATLPTPSRVTNLTMESTYQVGTTTLAVTVGGDNHAQTNQGLSGGFNLPERAFDSSANERSVRVSLLSTLRSRTVNEMRMEFVRRDAESRATTDAPAITVIDAFGGGGNQDQLFSRDTSNWLQLSDHVTFQWARHAIKSGASVRAVHDVQTNRANFGGTFTFGSGVDRDPSGNPILDGNGDPTPITPLDDYQRTLLGRPGYRPTFFSITVGDPTASVRQREYGLFLQDEWQLSPRTAISLGLREDFQDNVAHKLNLGPRGQISRKLDAAGKSTLRVGSGIFFDPVPASLTLDVNRLDGQRERSLLISAPAFFPAATPDLGDAAVSSASFVVRTKAADLTAPYRIVSTIAYERQLPGQLWSSATYGWTRGVNLLRTRDINAFLPGLPDVRPNPEEGPILQFESTARSVHHELMVSVRTNTSRKVWVAGNYVLASTRSDSDGPYTVAANSYDLSGEFGRAAQDYRHQAYFSSQIRLPLGLTVSPALTLRSGGPFNIVTGADTSGNGLLLSRPAFADPGESGSIATPFGTFNPYPGSGDTIIPRNFGQQPKEILLNLSVHKTFPLGNSPSGRRYLVVGAEGQNVTNHDNLTGVVGVLTSPYFGQPNQALPPRKWTFFVQAGF